jgi:hypothetical protein
MVIAIAIFAIIVALMGLYVLFFFKPNSTQESFIIKIDVIIIILFAIFLLLLALVFKQY